MSPPTFSTSKPSIAMMEPMRRSSLLLSFCLLAPLLPAADLAGVRSVYIMPMSRGMDQYLANRLANDHLFQVVTDPKGADAIFTDHIGESFEDQLDALLPSPEPVKKTPPAVPVKETSKDKTAPAVLLPTDADNKLPPVHSTFGAAKGTIFLVDLKSHHVVWSTYDPARSSDSRDMDHTASDIVSRLKKELSPKK